MGERYSSKITCSLCGGNDFRLVYEDEDKTLEIVECQKCKLVFQADVPNGVDDYYRERPTNAHLRWTGTVKRWEDVIQEIASRYPTGRLLDVGCGNGEFIDVMSKKGLSCVGLEPNLTQARSVKESTGLPVVNDVLKEGLFPPASFDVVTFIQVLEHLLDPLEALRIANSFLKPGGMVVIDVPSYDNPRFLLYRVTGIKRVVRRDFG